MEGIIVINGLRNIFSVSMFFYLTVIAHNCKMAVRAYGGRSSVFWAYGFLMYKLLHRPCENGRLTKHSRSAPRSLRLAAVLGLAFIPPAAARFGGG